MGGKVRRRLDHAPQAPLRRLEISFSQGGEWKALISKYIGIIPLTGDVCPAEHNISGWPPPRAPVSSAMIAKVGAAARYSQSTARGGRLHARFQNGLRRQRIRWDRSRSCHFSYGIASIRAASS
jgi:hypothetical protein